MCKNGGLIKAAVDMLFHLRAYHIAPEADAADIVVHVINEAVFTVQEHIMEEINVVRRHASFRITSFCKTDRRALVK